MKVFIGLGNPGETYRNNRHNVGHLFVDFCIKQLTGSRVNEFKLLKADTFMNTSGVFVAACVKRYKLHVSRDLYIVHDDLDIPFGKFKIQFGTGPKLHNGILSIEEELGRSDFWRVRIGVDARDPNPPAGGRIDGETYSLEDFTKNEQNQLHSVFQNIYKQLNP